MMKERRVIRLQDYYGKTQSRKTSMLNVFALTVGMGIASFIIVGFSSNYSNKNR